MLTRPLKEVVSNSYNDHDHRRPPRNRVRRRRHRRGCPGRQRLQGSLRGPRDIVGGRSAGYERSLRQARETAIEEMVSEAEQMGADAVIGVDVDYVSIQIGQGGSMLMVSASGTAVKL